MKIYTKRLILAELKKWKKGKEILQTLKRLKITLHDINTVAEKSYILKYYYENGKTYKYCNMCKSLKEHTAENYYKNKNWTLKAICKECCKIISRNIYKIKQNDKNLILK